MTEYKSCHTEPLLTPLHQHLLSCADPTDWSTGAQILLPRRRAAFNYTDWFEPPAALLGSLRLAPSGHKMAICERRCGSLYDAMSITNNNNNHTTPYLRSQSPIKGCYHSDKQRCVNSSGMLSLFITYFPVTQAVKCLERKKCEAPRQPRACWVVFSATGKRELRRGQDSRGEFHTLLHVNCSEVVK